MKVVVFAGPTGGHFFPALAFLEAFKKRYPQANVMLVTGFRGYALGEKAKRQTEVELGFIQDFPLPRPSREFLIRFPVFLIKMAQAFVRAAGILWRFKPDLCVGFGSYAAFPGVLLAHFWKVPTLIHEQNIKLGRANAWLSRWADQVTLSFESQEQDTYSRPVVVTGYPIRYSLIKESGEKRYRDRVFTPESRLRILLVGGSQGSQSINRIWAEIILSLSDEEKSKMAVFHITGENDLERFKQMYSTERIEAEVFPFYERMEELYSKADMAITRAGAGTLFELALFGLPAVILPYPHADGHQEANAQYFEKQDAVLLIPEHEASPTRLKEAVFELIKSPALRSRLSQNVTRLGQRNASEKLVDTSEQLLSREACLA